MLRSVLAIVLVALVPFTSGCLSCIFDDGDHYSIRARPTDDAGETPVDITSTADRALTAMRDAIRDAGPTDRSFRVHRSDSHGQERVKEALREASIATNGTPQWTSVLVDGRAYHLVYSHADGPCTE